MKRNYVRNQLINYKNNQHTSLAKKVIWLRLAQQLINEFYKSGDFQVPIHLALGHEAIAVAIDSVMVGKDVLLLTHRNVHYNLIRDGALRAELDEYYLRESGLAQGRLGSMNLNNIEKGIPYTSSILGNNLPVACGFALGNKVKKNKAVAFVITGDGAIEEGAFYESLLFMKSYKLSSVIVIENNNWSLATRVEERRAQINIEKLVAGIDIEYLCLENNDVLHYTDEIRKARLLAVEKKTPIVIEVKLTTLGYWHMVNQENPHGKFINYHSGPAPKLEKTLQGCYPYIESNSKDPVFVLKTYFSSEQLIKFSDEMLTSLQVELA